MILSFSILRGLIVIPCVEYDMVITNMPPLFLRSGQSLKAGPVCCLLEDTVLERQYILMRR